MTQNQTINRKVVLNSRPTGPPTLENFRLVEDNVPVPADGQVLLRTLFLSLDPYMRGRMSDAPSYAPPVQLGNAMVGGTINRVVESKNAKFRVGDLVLGSAGWQEYAVSDGKDLIPLGDTAHPSYFLGVLGMPGFTAYAGLLKIGDPQPGETVVVAAASGAVGSVVGQVAKLKGAHVVGIAGGAEKCTYVVDTLGFDACIDHRSPEFPQQLSAACPKGIDVYFENVGGPVFDAVLPLLNIGARVPVSGVIAHYNDTSLPPGPDRLPKLVTAILTRRLKFQGLIISDYFASTYQDFRRDMGAWLAQGAVKTLEDIVPGLEKAPEAFIGLLQGKNFGKLVIKVSDQ
ncbi:MAG: NADP-dependent oxidoreductase [Acidobacteriaceae bacterium]